MKFYYLDKCEKLLYCKKWKTTIVGVRLELVGWIHCEDAPVGCQLTILLICSISEWNIGGTTK